MEDPILKIKWLIEKRKLADLNLWDKNPRKIFAENFETLKENIKKQGFHAVLAIDTDNTILSGNQRKLALEQLGITEVYVSVPERKLTDEERDMIGITSNVQAGFYDIDGLFASFDNDLLSECGLDVDKMIGPNVPTAPKSVTADPKNKPPRITITFKTFDDLEQAKPEIEQIVNRYQGVQVAIGGGEL